MKVLTKACIKCKQEKVLDDFHNDKTNIRGFLKAYYCKSCANSSSKKHHHRRMKEDPSYQEAMKERYTRQTYGLTRKEYIEKLKAQGCMCAICRVELPEGSHLTHLDHCHTTGKIRAFLCTNCNRGLGHFQDSIENLNSAILYLKSHNSSED